MKLRVNPFTVGLTSSVIAYASNPVYQQNGGTGLLGALGTGFAAGLSYYLGSFIPNKVAARHAKTGMAYKKSSEGLNAAQQADAHNAAVPHFKRAGCLAMIGGALGITAAVFGYKFANPHIKEWAENRRTLKAKVVSFDENFSMPKNAVDYRVGLSSYKIA